MENEKIVSLSEGYFKAHPNSDACHITEDEQVFHGYAENFAQSHSRNIKSTKVWTVKREDLEAFKSGGKKETKKPSTRKKSEKKGENVDVTEMNAAEITALIQQKEPDFEGAEKTLPELIEHFNGLK